MPLILLLLLPLPPLLLLFFLLLLPPQVNSDLRCHILLEVFHRLANDTSKFVRNTALQQLGPFIATLKSEEVSDARRYW